MCLCGFPFGDNRLANASLYISLIDLDNSFYYRSKTVAGIRDFAYDMLVSMQLMQSKPMGWLA